MLVNPSFEEGQRGWAKYGGEFTISNGARHGGALSGQLTSATTSTKWVYQTVVIDPNSGYELSGYLRPQGDVKSAYLRISWYATFDGTGSALATDDSTARLTGPANDFVYFTTGPVAPPPFAHSARVRALLGPTGSSFATLFMDDFAFVQTGPASALLKPPKATAQEDDAEEPEPTPRAKNTATPTRTPQPPRAGETPEARAKLETQQTPEVIARIPATRTRPIPRLNSDGVEALDEPPVTNVLLVDDQAEAVTPIDYRPTILVSALLICVTIGLVGLTVKRRQA